MSQNWIFLLLAIGAGIVVPMQAIVNNKLTGFVEHPLIAVFISFIIGTLAILAYIFAAGIPLSNSVAPLKNAPLIAWMGGIGCFLHHIGCFFDSTFGRSLDI